MRGTLVIGIGLAAALAIGWRPAPAAAIPLFAHQYGVSCQKCHSTIPRLNEFGQAFLEHGYHMPPGISPGAAFPLSTKVNLAYSSEPDPAGLPKAIVDEVELFLAGQAGPRVNYFIEQYVVDGGRPGALRDAWFNFRLTPFDARIPVNVQAGQFTLPLSVDPETFRETAQHYAIFDQTVGDNPFNFFDPKTGAQLRIGDATHGSSVRLVALQGHDKQSGIASMGIDFMLYAQHLAGPVTLSVYRYAGERPDAAFVDHFWRQGYGIVFAAGRWTSETVLQTGFDSSFDGRGNATISSGGFSQLRYEFDRNWFALGRLDGTNDSSGFARAATLLLGRRIGHNARATFEDVVTHVPATKHTLNAQYTIGY